MPQVTPGDTDALPGVTGSGCSREATPMQENRAGLWLAFAASAVLAVVFIILWFVRGGTVDALARNLQNAERDAASSQERLGKEADRLRESLAAAVAKAGGGMNREEAIAHVGEKAVAEIGRRHGEDVFAGMDKPGMPSETVARAAGYDSAADMLSELAAAERIDARAEREANERLAATDMAEDAARDEQDEIEGVSDDAGSGEDTADVEDAAAEAELAIENEVTDGGKDDSFGKRRELAKRLRDWRDEQAMLSRLARETVSTQRMGDATDIRSYRKMIGEARRNALAAAAVGDKTGITMWKKRETYLQHLIRYAKEARKLRDRVTDMYSRGKLHDIINAAGNKAKIEYGSRSRTSRPSPATRGSCGARGR